MGRSDCETHVYSGTDCDGTSTHIEGARCVSGAFKSVKITC